MDEEAQTDVPAKTPTLVLRYMNACTYFTRFVMMIIISLIVLGISAGFLIAYYNDDEITDFPWIATSFMSLVVGVWLENPKFINKGDVRVPSFPKPGEINTRSSGDRSPMYEYSET